MTAVEWGRAQPSAPTAPASGPSARGATLWARAEFAIAAGLLLLMSQAFLGPFFNPLQNPDSAGWLRTLWLPVYGVILVLAASRFRLLRRVSWGAALMAPLLLLAFASAQWSLLPDVTMRRAIALAFTTLFGLWLAARFSWREVVALVAGTSVVLALGSYMASLLAPDFGVHSTIHPGAWRGLWYEKNSMGGFMAQGALACACAAVMLPPQRLLWGAGAALCAGLVLLSTSTTSLLALMMVVGGFLTIAGLRRGGAVAVAIVWGGLVAALLAGGLFAFAPDLLFNILGKDATLTGRTDIWDAVLRQVRERPLLGYGFGAFWENQDGPVGYVRAEVDWLAPTAHNGWLELLLSFGWVGACLFALNLMVVGMAAVVSLRRGLEAYWALIFVAVFVLFSLSESTIMQQNNLGWALYVMTAAKLFARGETEAAARTRKAKPHKPKAVPTSWAPAQVERAPASRLSFALGVGALLILSRTWLPLALGGNGGGDLGGQVQIVYVFAYLAAGMLAVSRLGDTLALLLRAPLLVFLLLLAAFSVFWSISPRDTAISVFALGGTTLAGVALASRFTWSELAEVLATAFAAIIVGSLVTGLVVPDIGRHDSYGGAWRGLYGHKNALGGAMAFALPIFAAAAAYNRRRLRLWSAFGVLAFVLLLLSASKTALLAALLGGAAFTAVAFIRKGGAATVAGTYAILVGVLAVTLVAAFAGGAVFEFLGKDATLTGRTEIWSAVLRQIEERPWFGFGYSALWEENAPDAATAWIFMEARHEVAHAHNSWLEIWLGVGLLGAVGFTLLMLKTWAAALTAVYRHGGALLAAPFVLAYTVTAVTESVALTYNDLRWVVFVTVAVKLVRWGQDPMTASASGSERLTSA